MTHPSLAALVVLGALLAGCTGNSDADAPTPGTTRSGEADQRLDVLQFADAASQVVESFEGRFEFTDNDQFAGEAHRAAGLNPDNIRTHDVTGLLPSSGVFRIEALVDADAEGGDIDAWFVDDGTIGHWRCECPFGGRTHVIAYAEADGGSVELAVQYDEISSGPTDHSFAYQGFDYSATVTVTTMPDMVPPGQPIAFRFEDSGDQLSVANHTQPITVYGPGDVQIAVLGPSDTVFEMDDDMDPGEYVFISQLDGDPFNAKILHSSPEARTGRILDIVHAFGSESFETEIPRMTFEAVPTVIEVGGCGAAEDVSVDPSFRMFDPSEAVWGEDAATGPSPFGWTACYNNWPGAPDQKPGKWTLEFTETAGQGAQLMWWTSAYER